MSSAPTPGLAGPLDPKAKPKKKERHRNKSNPSAGQSGHVGQVTTMTTTTIVTMNVDASGASSGIQNSEAKKRNRIRKKKPLVGQLPADPAEQDGDQPNENQPRQQATPSEPKKFTLLRRQTVSVEATAQSGSIASSADGQGSRKSADEPKATTSKASGGKVSNEAPKIGQTVLKTVEDVKVAVISKRENVAPKAPVKFAKKSSGNTETAGTANAKTTDGTKAQHAKEREPINEEAVPRLEREFIIPLRVVRNPRFSMASYYCRLCSCHINTLKFAEGHMKTPHHIRAKDEYYLAELLDSIPWPPTQAHCAALNALLNRTVIEHGRPTAERVQCFELAHVLTHYFRANLHPDCEVRLYGSSLTGFALKYSNVNLELLYPTTVTHAAALTGACKLMMRDHHNFSNVTPDFEAKWPSIKFNAAGVGFLPEFPVDCVLSVCNTQAFEIGMLLEAYAKRFPRLISLAQFCRYWAKTCRLDDAELGGLPPYAFDLMLVHHLQQRQPRALPVFHEIESFREPAANMEAFVRFCKDDAISFDGSLPLMKEDEWNLAELWISFLKYYTVDFNLQSLVVNIRSSKPVTRAEKDWRSSRRLGIEDPFLPNKNVAQMTQNMFDYTMHCLRMSYKYFGLPQTAFGPLFIFNDEYRLVLRDILVQLKQQRSRSGETMGQITGWDGAAEIQKMLVNLMKNSEADSESHEEKFDGNSNLPSHCYSREQLLDLHNDNHEWSPKWQRYFDPDGLPLTGLKHAQSAVHPVTRRANGSQHSDFVTNGDESISAPTYMQLSSTEAPLVDRETDGNIWDQQRQESVQEVASQVPQVPVESESQCAQRIGCIVSQRSALISEGTDFSNLEEEEPCGRLSEHMAANASDFIAEGDVEAESESTGNDGLPEAAAAMCSELENRISDADCTAISNGDDVGVNHVARTSETELQDCDQTAGENDEPSGPVLRLRRKTLHPDYVAAISELVVGDYYFIFSSALFTDGKTPAIICSFCNVVGHNARNCPEKRLPPVEPLLPISPSYADTLNYFLRDLYKYHAITPGRLRWQEHFRADLERRLQQTLRADARLQLFGSSCNGFGFVHSDLDLCLTFGASLSLPQDENPVKIIKLVANALRRDRDFGDVLPVTKAKVPIVRFFHYPSKLEGDISLYNCLALRNTQLLFTYSNIDPRVQALGYIVKVFAKYCDIGDASRGSLSSYAYVIMMLHYLQRTQPPVIPVLQEICGRNGRQAVLVDGWDTYFYADLQTLHSLWKSKNKQSLHDLWLGFLRYYTELFNAKDYVVQMRRFDPMTKFEKLWSDKPLAIEDPFDLNHNLAAGLGWRMYLYIMKVFIQAREAFGHPRHERILQITAGNLLTYDAMEKYFFDIALRQKEPPPKDRVCKYCGHVGHFVDTCPQKRSNQKKAVSADNEDDDDGADKDAGPSKAIKSASK